MVDRRKTYRRVVDAARELLPTNPAPTASQVAARAGVSLSTYYRTASSHAAVLADAGYVAEPSARERLLDAARELLGEAGMSNLLMDDVAARAGVSRGTLYRLFSGKAALIEALAYSRAPLAALGPALQTLGDQPPDEVLPTIITAATPHMLANRGMLRAILGEGSIEAAEGGPAREVISAMYHDLAAYIAKQMDAGRLRRTDPIVATIALVGPLLTFILTRPDFWFGEEPASDPGATIGELVQVWLRGMQP
jgi:AcrR family transcriptional regulator